MFFMTLHNGDDFETLADHASWVAAPVFRLFGWDGAKPGEIKEQIMELHESLGPLKDDHTWIESGHIRLTRDIDEHNSDKFEKLQDVHYGIFIDLGTGVKFAKAT